MRRDAGVRRRRANAMRRTRRAIGWTVALIACALMALAGWNWSKRHPEDLPWTKLELARPVGLFTGRKLAALTKDFPACRAALERAGVRYTALAPVTAERGTCGYRDGVRLDPGGSRELGFEPKGVGMACPVAAAIAVWEWEVVQPAARRHLRQPVATIEHFGSYNCRRMYGRDAGAFSEHATADALDVAGFRLQDGTRVTVVKDWSGGGDKAAFLREVHDGACGLFATVLGPDYNAAHRDHLHLDQAERGATGWRSCR